MIRSKNLDILFKREYYEQRIATQKQLSEAAAGKSSSEEKTDPEADDSETVTEEAATDSTAANTTDIISDKVEMVASTLDTPAETPSLDKIDPDEIREFKPMNHGLETPVGDLESGHTSPYHYPATSGHQYSGHDELSPDTYLSPGQQTGQTRPNLYLYSPSSNTLIPCEEIIIPNPVMSPETGDHSQALFKLCKTLHIAGEPVYTGPTNIYLAYPVQGPDGRSYITQPFPVDPGSGGYNSGYGYQHSVSYDGNTYYSSTPHTPNSGQWSVSVSQKIQG